MPMIEPTSEPSRQQLDDGDTCKRCKRVLVVDDSMEVRELIRSLLSCLGYDVQIAVDGVDGWNAILTGNFDLVLTDVDMPLFDGIRLTKRIRSDPRFRTLPVLIVCEQNSEQDRWRAFEAGANYYVIRGAFHDTLAQAVARLIGPAG